MRTDHLWCPLESEATLGLHFLSLIQGMNLSICSGLIRERPQPLGRLQFG
jgi:hypothetical protein